MFKNRKKHEMKRPNLIAMSIFIGMALGVIVSMIIGKMTGEDFLPIGIGAGMAMGAGVGAIFERLRRG